MSTIQVKSERLNSFKVAFFIAQLISLLTLFILMPRLSIPILLSYVLYLILNPLTLPLERVVKNKTLAILVLFIGTSILVIWPIVRIVPTIKAEVENLQFYVPSLEKFAKSKFEYLKTNVHENVGIKLEATILLDLLSSLKEETKELIYKAPNLLASILEWLFLVPLFLFFMLKDGRKFKLLILKSVPNSIFERAYYLSSQFNRKIGDYIFAKFIEATILGTIITLGLIILDVRFAIILGVVAAITNIIPYIGPFLGALPALMVTFIESGVSYGESLQTYGVAILYLVANAIDLAFIFPILVSKIVNLHPVVVIVSVVLGSHYMGVMGMVVSVPIAAVLKLVYQEIFKELYHSDSSFDKFNH